jgi:hypothetical protein
MSPIPADIGHLTRPAALLQLEVEAALYVCSPQYERYKEHHASGEYPLGLEGKPTMATLTQSTVAPAYNPLRRSIAIVREDLRAYIALNVVYYGLVGLGMIYVAFFNPGLQQGLLQAMGQAFTVGPLSALGNAYGGGEVLNAIALTFVVNLVLGTLLQISLPALIIPFSGLLMGLLRACLWGLLFAPTTPELAGPMAPHALTLLLEGQAYIVAMLAVFVQGKAFLWPRQYGKSSHLQGYVEGLRRTVWLYLLITLLLAVAAIYEALEVIYLAPLFR